MLSDPSTNSEPGFPTHYTKFQPTACVAQREQFPSGRVEFLPGAGHMPTALAPRSAFGQERVAHVGRLAQVTAERLACRRHKNTGLQTSLVKSDQVKSKNFNHPSQGNSI